jgi:hypothetical protein
LRGARVRRVRLSAYEHCRKSPSLDTVDRLIAAAGYELEARPRIEFVDVAAARGRVVRVPSRLPGLPVAQALAAVQLPLTVNWSQPGRVFRLSDRGDRARVYELVLREGGDADVLAYIDGALLVDLWDELVLPNSVRAAWSLLIDQVRGVVDVPVVA